MMKLYRVDTVVKQFQGCRDVQLCWFRNVAPGQRKHLYPEMIENYDPADEDGLYSAACIDELFTEDEARQLKEFLDRENGHEGTTTISEETLPIKNCVLSLRAIAIPVGGPQGFLMIHAREGYSLPFKAEGYYDLRGRELIDGSGIYDY
jgi:hypothetical protein